MEKLLFLLLLLNIYNISLAKELTLQEIINLGLKNNPVIKSKYYNYKKSIFAEKESFWNLLPKISVEYKYFKQQEKKLEINTQLPVINGTIPTGLLVPYKFSFTFVPSSFYSFNLMLKEVFSPALYQAYKLSKDVKNISFYNFERIKNEIIYKISKGYFEYQKSLALYKLAQSYLNLTSNLYRDSKYLYKKGLINRQDLLQSKYYYQKSIENLIKALNYKQISKKYLETLTNSKIEAVKILKPYKLISNILNTTLKSENYYYKLAQTYNPTFKILSKKESIAYKKYKLEKSKFFPNIFGFAGYTKTNQFEALGSIDYFSIGFGISLELGVNNYQSLLKQKKEILETIYENKNVKNLIKLNINQTLYKLQNNLYKVKTALVRLEEAKVVYKMAKLRYKEGLSTSKDVHDAIKDITEAEKDLAEGVFDYLINYNYLNYLTGYRLRRIY